MVLLLVFYTFIIGWMGWLAGWVEDITGGKGCQGIKKHYNQGRVLEGLDRVLEGQEK